MQLLKPSSAAEDWGSDASDVLDGGGSESAALKERKRFGEEDEGMKPKKKKKNAVGSPLFLFKF